MLDTVDIYEDARRAIARSITRNRGVVYRVFRPGESSPSLVVRLIQTLRAKNESAE
jgi:hypothetical protein